MSSGSTSDSGNSGTNGGGGGSTTDPTDPTDPGEGGDEGDVTMTLTDITITKQPTKTEYNVGEAFETDGMTVTATYQKSDGSTEQKEVIDYTCSPTSFDREGEAVDVTISYTEGDVTKTATVTVKVTLNLEDWTLSEGGTLSVPAGATVTADAVKKMQEQGTITAIKFEGSVTIGADAFKNNHSITNVTFGGSTVIEEYAFMGCDNLTTVTGWKNVTSFGVQAFSYCSNLSSVDLSSSSLTSIGDDAFSNSGLTSVKLPSGLTSIGNTTFENCTSLTSVDLPAGLDSIGNVAFRGCSALTSVDLSGCAITSIGNVAFSGCSALTSIDLSACGEKMSIGVFAFSGEGNLALKLPDDVSDWTVGMGAFSGRMLTLYYGTNGSNNDLEEGGALHAFQDTGVTVCPAAQFPSNNVTGQSLFSSFSTFRDLF